MKWKFTHQLEILNATNEVGSVGPPTLNVHTICKWEKREKEKKTEFERGCSHFTKLSCFSAARPSNILFCVLLPLLKRHFSPWVKFNWNASNRIKDFWNATRLPFQSKHYAQGELCYCSTPFIHQWAILALTPTHPAVITVIGFYKITSSAIAPIYVQLAFC